MILHTHTNAHTHVCTPVCLLQPEGGEGRGGEGREGGREGRGEVGGEVGVEGEMAGERVTAKDSF